LEVGTFTHFEDGMREQQWTRRLVAAVGVAAAVLVAPRLEAQGAAPGSAKLVATWSGDYTTDGPSGTMTLTIAKEGTAWKVTNALGGEVPPPGEVREIEPDGDKITFKQTYGEYDVTFTGTLSADGKQLTGTISATQGGAPVGGGSFTLTRK
jgi:hypothetical protein